MTDKVKKVLVWISLFAAMQTFWPAVITLTSSTETLLKIVEVAGNAGDDGLTGFERFDILWEDYITRSTHTFK